VHEAANGLVAMAVLREAPPDVIVTDLVMPEKEGIEIIREIRQDHPDLPIIAVSGGGRVAPDCYLELASKLGADRPLVKPLTRDELIGAVHDVLDCEARG